MIQSFKKVGSTVVEKAKFSENGKLKTTLDANNKVIKIEEQKTQYNVSTKEGAFNQFKIDNNVENYTKALAAINNEVRPVAVKSVKERYSFVDGTKVKRQVQDVRTNTGIVSNAIFTIENASQITKTSPVQPHYFQEGEYFLLYVGGKCYYQSGLMTLPTILIKRSSKENTSSEEQCNDGSVIFGLPHGEQPVHLTQSDYNSIVASNPSKESLFKIYRQLNNADKVKMNTNILIPVW